MDKKPHPIQLSKFSDYLGLTADPKSMKVASVSVTVPFFLFFERTIKKVPIIRPHGSRYWQFLDGERTFILFEQCDFNVFGRTVNRTPDGQAEALEAEYLLRLFGDKDPTYRFITSGARHG